MDISSDDEPEITELVEEPHGYLALAEYLSMVLSAANDQGTAEAERFFRIAITATIRALQAMAEGNPPTPKFEEE